MLVPAGWAGQGVAAPLGAGVRTAELGAGFDGATPGVGARVGVRAGDAGGVEAVLAAAVVRGAAVVGTAEAAVVVGEAATPPPPLVVAAVLLAVGLPAAGTADGPAPVAVEEPVLLDNETTPVAGAAAALAGAAVLVAGTTPAVAPDEGHPIGLSAL